MYLCRELKIILGTRGEMVVIDENTASDWMRTSLNFPGTMKRNLIQRIQASNVSSPPPPTKRVCLSRNDNTPDHGIPVFQHYVSRRQSVHFLEGPVTLFL